MALLLIAVSRNDGFIKNNIIICSIVCAMIGLYSIGYFVADYFTGKGVDDAVIYHLQYGLVDAGYREYALLITLSVLAVAAYALAPVLITYGKAGSARPAR